MAAGAGIAKLIRQKLKQRRMIFITVPYRRRKYNGLNLRPSDGSAFSRWLWRKSPSERQGCANWSFAKAHQCH
jgi:hypothetical protein